MPVSLNIADVPRQLRSKLDLPRVRKAGAGFSKEAVRSKAIRVLSVIHDLSQQNRRRVLEFALKLNRI
jgi:hypothetical protein